jgi:lipopolysaccharide/colanic/teichoic acid biosynthesis glycosyltransferase
VPGITGLWQISGRSNLDFDQRLKLDIAYIERQSIWMDICIIARTVGQVFIGEGAY